MFDRLYYRFLLFVLPNAEGFLNRIQKLVQQIDRFTDAIERRVEDQVVAIAESARARRETIAAINDRFDAADQARIEQITADRTELNKARAARNAVETILNRG